VVKKIPERVVGIAVINPYSVKDIIVKKYAIQGLALLALNR